MTQKHYRAAMTLIVMILTTLTAWAITGSGTKQAPYIIHNASDWNTAAQDTKYYYNDGTHVYVELDADIDFSGKTFKRYGQNPNNTTPGSCYIHFDGKGHTIKNITMNQGSNNYAAPFGNLVTGSTISNLTVANSSFTADKWVAGITCKNMGTITNCHVESTVTLTANKTSTSEYCGGIAAQNGIGTSNGTNIGTITNCTVGAKFVLVNRQNEAYFGGIVGRNDGESPVSGCLCYSTDVTANLNYFKILIGRSYNNGNVVTNNYYRPVGNYGHGAPDGTATHVRAVSGIPSGVTVSPAVCVSHGGFDYLPANTTITLTAPDHKVFKNDFSASGTGSSYSLSSDKKTATVKIATADVTVNATIIPDPAHFAQNSDGSYTINTAIGWGLFCELLEENAKGYFTGKTVTLANSIGTVQNPVTRMAGTSSKPFTGIFNGGGKTLTVSYENTSGETRTAPFSYVDGATIQNLIVDGTITGSNHRAAGLIGETGTATSHIINCVSSLTISSGRYTGGFSIGGNVEIEGCLFNGKINGSSMSGGFVGYSNSKLKIKNCLFAPQSGSSISGGTFYFNGGGDITPVNSYYTQALGTAQGTQARTVTAGDQYVTTCTVSPKGSSTTYNLSGITAYNNGIVRDGTFYYGRGDQVSLTLAHSTREGYTFNSYTPSAGTLNGTTLTMPDADVTIGCTWTANQYTVTLDGQTVTTAGTTKVTATYDAAMPAITLPTRTGYTFGGYFTTANGGGTQYYKADGTSARNWNIAQDTKLYAKWTINKYTISFNTNGGIPATIAAITQDYDTPITAPANPTRTAYTFAGWDKAIPAKMPAGDMTITAQWTPIDYPITYNLDGGTLNTVHNSYTIESSTIALDWPTRKGYSFEGWYDNEGLTGSRVNTIDHGSTGTVTLYAKWKINTYTITYNLVYGNVAIANDASYDIETKTFTLNNPTKDHFTFTGWTGSNGDTPETTVTIEKGSTGDRTYTANYEVGAHDGTCGTDVYYAYNSTTKTLDIFGIGDMSNYPNSSQQPWYSYRGEIKKVSIGNGVKSIGDNAFVGCTSLPSIDIPASVTSIGDNAFVGCTSLTRIDIPTGVTSIGDDAFASCTSLLDVFVHSATPPTLGSIAFDACTALNAIHVPAGTAETVYKAADNWKDYADKIYAADGTCGDVYYIYDSTTKTLRIFGTGAIKGNGVENSRAYRSDIKSAATGSGEEYVMPWESYCEEITTVVIGHGVTGIGQSAFLGCTGLTSIDIPSSVTRIAPHAFRGCTSLTSIDIPASVTTIESDAFQGCTSLKSIDIPVGVTKIYCNTFQDCTSLTSIVIPYGVTRIDHYAFYGCTSLESINLPASVEFIEYCVFWNCSSLTSIEIPASATHNFSPGAISFFGCSKFNSLKVAAGNPVYDSRNDCNAIIETKTNTLIAGCKSTVIPNDVTSIYPDAFFYCPGLTSIEIPANVKSIGASAFDGCTSLSSVTIYAPELDYYGSVAFDNNAEGRKIYVPSKSLDTYRAHAREMGVDPNDILPINIHPIEGISLKDAADNRSLIAAANGHTLNVTLQDRTLRKDGKWNTLCLPFTLALNGSPLEGATVLELDVKNAHNGHYTGFDATTGTLYLNFQSATTIEAGKPYIVKWGNAGDLESPVFNGVTISSIAPTSVTSADGKLTFTGTYAPASIGAEGDNATLSFADNGKLYHPNIETTIGCQRAYFRLDGISISGKGDVNGDGVIDNSDVECMANHLLGKANPTFIATNADMNQTKAVDISDLTSLVNLLLDSTAVKKVVINAE